MCIRDSNQDTSAIFTYDDFLTGTDVELTLGRYFVKATAAGIALNSHNSKTVACVVTDALVSYDEARFDHRCV